MPDLPFPWVFIALASIIDLVGLFYLWRRRKSSFEPSHRPFRISAPIFLADRRRRERRGTGAAARGAGSIPA
jgi:hypothetical protein